jgi:tellurite resistance protein
MMKQESRLQYFPISYFSIVMGLVGLTLSIQKAEGILQVGSVISTGFLIVSSVIFFLIAIMYTAKLIKYPNAVKEEFNNPVRLSFFPTVTISVLLLSTASLELTPQLSFYLWAVGATAHLVATMIILSQWIWQTTFEIHHFSPAWFIPIVGNILVPIAGTAHGYSGVSWFFFSIGIVFWILMFTIFLYRIVFHKSLPEKLLPTFFILIAPPSLAFISYVKLTGGVDQFGLVLYNFALFLVLFLAFQIRVFSKAKFYLSAWAYSFPIASFVVATSLMYKIQGAQTYYYLFFTMLFLLSILILTLIYKTGREIHSRGICVKEE